MLVGVVVQYKRATNVVFSMLIIVNEIVFLIQLPYIRIVAA